MSDNKHADTLNARADAVALAVKDISAVLNRTMFPPPVRLGVLRMVVAAEGAYEDLWIRATIRELTKDGGKSLMAAMTGQGGAQVPPQGMSREEVKEVLGEHEQDDDMTP